MVTKLGQGHIFYLYVKDKKSKCSQVRGTFFYFSWPETKAQVMKFFSLSVVVVVVVNFLHLYFLLILTKFGTKHSWEKGFGFFLYYLLFFITFTNLSYIRHCWSISTHSSFIWQCNNSFGISTTFLTYDVHENIVIWWLIMLWKFFLYVRVRKNRNMSNIICIYTKTKEKKKVKQNQDKKKSCTLNYNC